MNIFGLLGLASFFKSMRPKQKHTHEKFSTPSWVGNGIDELSEELDYFVDKFKSFKSKMK